jgi:alpha-galactosidase
MSNRQLLCGGLCLFVAGWAGALEESEIPMDAPQDAIMAGPEEVRTMQGWASTAFQGTAVGTAAVRVELRRQDHSLLRFRQSCLETPLRIGQRTFEHGLGTHANSEIVLHLPAGARTFKAFAGIDNNFNTQGRLGSVEFSLEIGGKQAWRSTTLRGGQEPVAVSLDLPAGTREITLTTDATPDGPAHDQADWAEARLVMEDGKTVWADEDRPAFIEAALPFSFLCDGAPSAQFLAGCERSATTRTERGRQIQTVTWKDAKTGLQVSATATSFPRYPAVEWLLHFENTGTNDTPLLENIKPLDARVRTGFAGKPVVLHRISGDVCGEQSFFPVDTVLEAEKPLLLSPEGGRPSNGAFPFFNLAYGDEGMFTAIGWSGQWAARFEREARGPTRVQAGMERTCLRLHPGERIRTPRILVMTWKGDRQAAHNRWRRLLLFEYVPRQNGRPLRLPVALQCFDRYINSRPEWATEAGQLRGVRATRELGCDTHWLDAGWFEGGFPNGVGNLFYKPTAFPNGLKPIGNACQAAGLQFLVWFEPERVATNTQIAVEHPTFVHGGKHGGLFKLGEAAPRRWLTDQLLTRLQESGITAYRNDFNLNPLVYWHASDKPDRQGMTEIRYVEGHYAMWDELIARQPGLWIDNCASGGRRIDLETLMRSVTLWRSDTGCSPGHAAWDQSQAHSVAQYLPLFASCAWEPTAYVLRSAASAGIICQFDYLNESFSTENARAALAEVKENQKFWYGDFYPLTRASLSPDVLVGWQCHRADLNAGIVLLFRRNESAYPAIQLVLRGLQPQSRYAVEFIDEQRARRQAVLTGQELMSNFEVRLPTRGSSLLVRYRPE